MEWMGVEAVQVPPGGFVRWTCAEHCCLARGLFPGEPVRQHRRHARDRARRRGIGAQPRFDIDLSVDTFSLDAYRLREAGRAQIRRCRRSAEPAGLSYRGGR